MVRFPSFEENEVKGRWLPDCGHIAILFRTETKPDQHFPNLQTALARMLCLFSSPWNNTTE